MAILPEKPNAKAIEEEARSLWIAQRLPPQQGPVGPAEGPVVHQFEGTFAPQEAGMLVAQRAVAADVDARAMILMGRRAQGILRKEEGGPPIASPRTDPLLTALGIWVGGSFGRAWDSAARRAEVETLAGRLAHMGAIAVRDVSLRICPACAMARSPERIVYQEEDGDTLLVRFPFMWGDRTVSALVWTDAAWRLLGTSALMLNPDLPYVIARYRRRESEELIFTSKSSLDRIRGWLPGAEIEVLEEHPGLHWVGQAYVHPLRHEFPMGGSMMPPAGTILSVADVGDSGTGVVPLVPGHGGTDAQIAERLNVPGWPLITPKGRFDILLVHKYAGLELESGSEFVVRDLAEGGAIFARLRVRRGVPHCSRCGTALIWAPGRAWCLEPSRLPEEKVAVYRSLLPRDRPIEKLEAVPWPISEPQRSDDPQAIALLECTSCDRLESIAAAAKRCPCGGRRRAVRRRLLPAFDGAASAWASVDPVLAADTVRLYVNERRRAPAVVHHIAAMSGVGGTIGEVRLTILPTVPEADLATLISRHGADAVRAALVRAQASEGATATFEERCAQERRRLEAFWRSARDIVGRIDGPSLSAYGQPIGTALGELEPEDRALLARFERLRIQSIVDFDRSAPALVHRRLFQFLENDFRTYQAWVVPRLAYPGSPPTKRAALRTLVHIVSNSTLLLGPIAPHFAEAVHRSLRRGRASLFEEASVGVDRSLIDAGRAKAWDRWVSVLRSVDRFRHQAALPRDTAIPLVVLVLDTDAAANEYRAEASTVERLGRVQRIEVGSPGAPWTGRHRQLRPIESEIQRVYASRAAQIIHLLRRMPERKWADPASGQEFSMIVNGQTTRILPSMIAWVETLPDRVQPVGWSQGELYAELPVGQTASGVPPPPLSPDGFRIVTRIVHRIRATPSTTPKVVVVAAPAALAVELSGVSDAIAKHIGLKEFLVVASDRELPQHGLETGRTKAGASWSFHISGAPPPVHAVKIRPPRAHGTRMRPAFAPGELAPTVLNYADDHIIAEETSIRALGEQLDALLGVPLLGPAKVRCAWDAGLRSVEAYREAPWISLVGIPGFGDWVATALVTKFGGTVPPRPPRASRPSPLVPANGETEAILGPSLWQEHVPPRMPEGLAIPNTVVPPRAPAPTVAPAGPRANPPALVAGPPSLTPLSTPDLVEAAPMAPASVPPLEPPDLLPLPADLDPGQSPEEPAISTELVVKPTPPEIASGADSPIAESEPLDDSADATIETQENPDPSTGPVLVGATFPEEVPVEGGVAPAEDPQPVEAPATLPEDPQPGEAPTTLPEDSQPGEAPTTLPEGPEPTAQPPPVEPGPPESQPVAAPENLAAAPPLPPDPSLVVSGPEFPGAPSPDGLPVAPAPPPHEVEAPPGIVAEAAPPIPGTADRDGLASVPLPESTPEHVLVVAANPPPELLETPSGGVELAVGPSYVPCLERFLEATAAGHQGVCVVRDSPERVRAYIGSRPVEIRWLTNIGRGPTLKPADLDGFSAFLAHAVSTGNVTAFFLEGVEYLVRLHGLERVVDRMLAFDRLARVQSARAWVPLNPKLLSPAELDRFVSAFKSGSSPA
jgi:hypothetical protein